MKIIVLLFAGLREAAETSRVEMEVPALATPKAIAEMLAARFPKLAGHLNSIAYAIDGEFVAADTTLRESCELALLPPVSGG